MILLTPDLRAALRANAEASVHLAAHDPAPVAKLFSPMGAATWLVTELLDDGDTLFGLADLGFGCPELGYFSLGEITRVRLPFGLGIERDLTFATTVPLSVWADTARRTGSILHAESVLRRAASTRGDGPAHPSPDPSATG